MAATKHFPRIVSHVILDLDGTLLNTDGVMNEVLKVFLVKYGKRWDNKISQKIIGRTPLEVATAIVKDYSLSLTTEELMSAISPMFSDQWCNIKALPGANRLIKHLRRNGVPMALASNSSKSCIEAKISFHQGWKESFSVIIGGDEVTTGKPSPEIFLEAAKRMNVDLANCLVIEDSLPGVVAGKAAGMEVVAVPSLPKQAGLYSSADEVINSLLDLHPEKWGLPPFEDWIEGTLPIEPWYIGGPVIKGFGRGSKVLGIPTGSPYRPETACVSACTSVSTDGTPVSTGVSERKKKRRRGRDGGEKRQKEGRRGSDGGGRTEEEEKRPYLRRGGAVRSWQAEVTIDCSFGGDVHESWRGGGGDNAHKRCVGGGDACERCLCSACVRSGKLGFPTSLLYG